MKKIKTLFQFIYFLILTFKRYLLGQKLLLDVFFDAYKEESKRLGFEIELQINEHNDAKEYQANVSNISSENLVLFKKRVIENLNLRPEIIIVGPDYIRARITKDIKQELNILNPKWIWP